ncbi:MAG: hypothetical protein PUD59_03715 [bacterium]|nr:hypothetical protein [bacterium]
MEIVGKYRIARIMTMVGTDFGFFTADDVLADLNKKLGAGEIEEDDIAESMSMFNSFIEFTPDHKVKSWAKLPEGVSDEEIKAAVEAGQISEVSDGYFVSDEKEWKEEDGKFYYNTNEVREVFDESLSSWDELAEDENGEISFGSGMMRIARI